MQLNNETANILIERYIGHMSDSPASWTTVTMAEIQVNDIFRFGGKAGRVFRALANPTDGPIAKGVWQVRVEEIILEKWWG